MCFFLLKISLTLHSRRDEVLDDLCSFYDERERKSMELTSLISLVKYSMLLLKTHCCAVRK